MDTVAVWISSCFFSGFSFSLLFAQCIAQMFSFSLGSARGSDEILVHKLGESRWRNLNPLVLSKKLTGIARGSIIVLVVALAFSFA